MIGLSQPFQEKLLQSKDYRGFLDVFFKVSRGAKAAPLTYGELAKRAGFKSRSFLNEVVLGRRRLTSTSTEKVIHGLKLDSTWAKYLRLLVEYDEAQEEKKSELLENLERLRNVIRTRIQKKDTPREGLKKVLLKADFPEVYAALGSGDQAVHLTTVVARTDLPQDSVRKILNQMESVGLVTSEGDLYLPCLGALDLNQLGRDEFLKMDFFRACEKAKLRFDQQAAKQTALFTTQTYLVSEKKLPELRQRLSALVQDFVDTSEMPDGDTVAELVVALTHS